MASLSQTTNHCHPGKLTKQSTPTDYTSSSSTTKKPPPPSLPGIKLSEPKEFGTEIAVESHSVNLGHESSLHVPPPPPQPPPSPKQLTPTDYTSSLSATETPPRPASPGIKSPEPGEFGTVIAVESHIVNLGYESSSHLPPPLPQPPPPPKQSTPNDYTSFSSSTETTLRPALLGIKSPEPEVFGTKIAVRSHIVNPGHESSRQVPLPPPQPPPQQ